MSPKLPVILVCLLAWVLAAPSARTVGAADPPTDPAAPADSVDPGLDRFGDQISVALATVRARFLDSKGAAIAGLKPADVRVKIGRRSVPVVAVDYYDGAVSAGDDPDVRVLSPTEGKRRYHPHQVSARGQLFVFFVEVDLKDSSSPLDTTAHLRRLAASLPPGALAAVVSFDSRLKLQLDLTRDREAAYQAILRGRQGAKAVPPTPPVPPTTGADRVLLAHAWNEPAAAALRTVDEALGWTAAALDPLPGEKVVIFLGEGPSKFSPPTVVDGKLATPEELRSAIRALQTARAAVFVLDGPRSSQGLAMDYLRTLAESTGGTYNQARRSAREAAVDRLLRETAGYSLVTFNLEQLEGSARTAPLTLELVGRPGTVLSSPFRVVNLGR